jgi:hypothetical protein
VAGELTYSGGGDVFEKSRKGDGGAGRGDSVLYPTSSLRRGMATAAAVSSLYRGEVRFNPRVKRVRFALDLFFSGPIP